MTNDRNDRNYILILIFTICISLACGIAFGSFLSNADSSVKNDPIKYKYYTSIKIHSGLTLWDIANVNMSEEYDGVNSYIAEVKQINSLLSDEIHAGQYLTVPYYSSDYK